jgi:pimeloyl-ACP methyl ester carboxylesterase
MNGTIDNIYCISGLGADYRAFQNLKLPGYQLKHIQWIPISSTESLESYTKKLLLQIEEKNPLLMGLSFGGIIATEMAKQIQTRKVILISSIKSHKELPFYFKWLGKLHFHQMIPNSFFTNTNPITNWLFGAASLADKKLLQNVFRENEPSFLRWCIGAIASWKNHSSIPDTYHIHGSADRLFPIVFITHYHVIKKGGHLMILNKSFEISKLILDILK